MGTATISIEYGTYANFAYKKPETTVDLSWEAPDDLEEKYVKQFDAKVAAGIKKLEKDLSSGVNSAKQWLADADKKLTKIEQDFNKNRKIGPEDIKYYQEVGGMLPDLIENLEKQRVKVFESMLDGILSDAVDDIVKTLKIKLRNAKIKKVVKITAYAVLMFTAAAAALAVSIVTLGAAAPAIIALVSASIGILGALATVGLKTKSMWAADKNEAKNLEAAAKTYADAAAAFSEVLERQGSQLAAKKAQLAQLGKQIDENAKNMTTLETLSKKADLGPKAEAKLADAKKSQADMMAAYESLNKDIDAQEKLLKTAQDKKSFEAAKAYADQLSKSTDLVDRINEQGSNINTAISTVATILSAFG